MRRYLGQSIGAIRGASDRARAIGLFAATSLAARAAGIGCQLLQVPIALHALGAEAFGLWMTLMSVTYMITFADLGVGIGMQNKLVEAFAAGDRAEARRLFATAFLFLTGVAVLLAALLLPAAALLDASDLFGLREPQTRAASNGAMIAFLGAFCLGFPFGLAQRLAYAGQRGWIHNVSQALGNALALVAVWLTAAKLALPLWAVIVAATVPMALSNAVLMLLMLKQLGPFSLADFRFEFAKLRHILSLGALFSIQQISNLILFGAPAIILSATLGAAAVAPFNVAQRFFNLFAVIQNAFMIPLWPAYSDAKARGEWGWMRRTLQRSIFATLGLSIAPMALGAVLAPWIIWHWVRDAAAVPAPGLIWLLFAWNAIVFLQQPFGYLLAGVSEVRRPTAYAVATAAAALAAMILLAPHFQANGVVFGLLLGFVPFNLAGNMFEAFRFLRTAADHPVSAAAPQPAT